MFSHLTVIILAMGLSGFFLLSSLERYFLQAAEDSLIAQARITAQALIPGGIDAGPVEDANAPFNTVQQQQVSNLYIQTQNVTPPAAPTSFDLTYLTDASLQLGAQLNTRIRILDEQGLVLVDSWLMPAEDLHNDPLIVEAQHGEYASRTVEGPDGDMMDLMLPVWIDDQLAGTVYLSQPLNDVAAVLGDLRLRWLISTSIGLLLSGVVGLLLSGAIARPLRRLTAAAGAVALGRFDQQVQSRSRDELGQLSRAFNDMTARLQAARQIQTDFVANVSHELRTPLTSIKGMVETLRGGAVDDPEVRDSFLGTVESETDRMIRLVNDLLILTRADSAALNLRREAVNLSTLARAAINQLAPQVSSKKVNVQLEVSTLNDWADSDRTTQVLVNLLDNAVKYSHPSGKVMVSVERGPDHDTLVTVRDQGIGITASDLPRIGQRFYRADKARSRAQGGSGLGLAIAQALVQAQGGRLWIESQEGAGTVVRFTLPSDAH
jgi:signal transduction histidine kinase